MKTDNNKQASHSTAVVPRGVTGRKPLAQGVKPKECLATRGRQARMAFNECCGRAGLHSVSCRHGQTSQRNGGKGGAMTAALCALGRLDDLVGVKA